METNSQQKLNLSFKEAVLVLATGLLSIVGGRGLAIYEAPDKLVKLENRIEGVEEKLDDLVDALKQKGDLVSVEK